ncbi:MAG TPA: sigma-54 dependent transcriptional regulator [Candidatus Krumholzibacteria bacterium]|nr:sigma-54 dependent transcriptional regulator [Candidatus Krumholzibacteria bacterium]
MAAHLLALASPRTFAALFDSGPPPWDVTVRHVTSAADAVRAVETHEDFRLLLVERDVEAQLGRLVQRVRRSRPGLEILLLAPAVSDAVRAEYTALGLELLDRGQDTAAIRQEIERRLTRLDLQRRAGILGRSRRIHEILETILQIGPSDIPVLVTGASGSGKELVARALYSVSRRQERPFIALNVGALSETVLESELFGHERGAFTGAVARKAGVFERADGGTLFLDEVGEMSPAMQVRLLRALESGEITPVGGSQGLHVDVRILAATNRRLEDSVRRGEFREDLYYRLKVVHIEMPSLAERPEDLPELVQHFLLESSRQYGTPGRTMAEGAMRALQAYGWPGNVRELRNVVFRMAVLARRPRLEESDLPEEVRQPALAQHLPVPLHRSPEQAEREIILQSLLVLRRDLQEVLRLLQGKAHPAGAVVVDAEPPPIPAPTTSQNLRENEEELIRNALRAAGGNRRAAAARLGIAERTLYRKIKEYQIS